MKKIGHNNPPIALDPKETIKKNIRRRKMIVDHGINTYENLPLPTWIELSLIDVCNRSCSFCPKSDPTIAPDTYMKMSRALVDKLYKDLKKINYNGSIALCGYGEPLLHKDIEYITAKLSKIANVEIKHVDIDPTMVRAIAKQAEAERERRAKIINAEGEFQAAKQLDEASAILAKRPETMQLRYLGTMNDFVNAKGNTTLLPIPLDLLTNLLGRK